MQNAQNVKHTHFLLQIQPCTFCKHVQKYKNTGYFLPFNIYCTCISWYISYNLEKLKEISFQLFLFF